MINSGTQNILLYTMAAGLGDYLIMGDVMRKAKKLLPQSECIMAYRANPHTRLWPDGDPRKTFCNIFSPGECVNLVRRLRRARRAGTKIFGLQMAPGSVQGYLWYLFLKKLGGLDYIVDFNLINADIITSPKGEYLLDWQLNQLKELFKIEIPPEYYQLNLPVNWEPALPLASKTKLIGIHPWSRRSQHPCFVWTDDNWIALIGEILRAGDQQILIFGRDQRFQEFQNKLLAAFPKGQTRIIFQVSSSVPDLIKIVSGLDLLISVNTSVAHIAGALKKPAVILNGPTFHPWIPKGENIRNVFDQQAQFTGVDRYQEGTEFPDLARIRKSDVLAAVRQLMP